MVLPFLKNNHAKWSLIVLIGSLLASVLNYVFTLAMGRLLSPSFFGEVSTIFGLLVIIVAPTQAISNYVSRHISFLAGKKDYLTARIWLRKMFRVVLFFSLFLLFFFWFFIPLLSRFLGIDHLPLFIFSFSVPFAFILSVYSGTLQGLKFFKAFSMQNILGAASKLFLAIILVYFGLFVPGVMLALILSLGIVSFYNYTKIKSVWKNLNLNLTTSTESKFLEFSTILKSISSKSFLIVFMAALLIALISNIDIILVKHFLNPVLAGEYAALSTMGKILIYVASAFVTVMFAMVSESFIENRAYVEKIFKNTLLYITAISLPAILVFGFAPNIIVRVFFGVAYINIAPYLPIFTVAMFLLSLSIAFIYYFLATRNNLFLIPFSAGVLLQIILIILNHSNIQNIVMSMLWSSIFLLSSLITSHFFYERF